MMIISIVVFLGNVSIYVQVLSAMMVILVALALQSKHNPYVVSSMNELELRGILVAELRCTEGCMLSQAAWILPPLSLFLLLLSV